ncbi:MAG: hypothetical protein E3K32_09985 [wastewater metagenome]|nr:hypothetical protein [Candidatus Loosdrechtia aerotolerans]
MSVKTGNCHITAKFSTLCKICLQKKRLASVSLFFSSFPLQGGEKEDAKRYGGKFSDEVLFK